MEIGTAFFFGALGTACFLIGRLVEKRFSGSSTKIKALGPFKIDADKNPSEVISSILKQIGEEDYGKPDKEISIDKSLTRRFIDLETKSHTLSRAVVLFKRRSDDLWMDIRDKYKLHKVNHLQISDDYTKLKVYK